MYRFNYRGNVMPVWITWVGIFAGLIAGAVALTALGDANILLTIFVVLSAFAITMMAVCYIIMMILTILVFILGAVVIFAFAYLFSQFL